MTKILIVDDEITIRNGLAAAVAWKEHGFSVAGLARNGVEALRLFKENNAEIIISDVKMPRMDGIELLKHIHGEYDWVPFVFISGYDEFEFAYKAINNGAFAYILKPIDTDELMDILIHARDKLLNNSMQQAGLGSFISRNLLSLDSWDTKGFESLYATYMDYNFCIVNLRLQPDGFLSGCTQAIQFLQNAHKLVALLLDKDYVILETNPQRVVVCLYSLDEIYMRSTVRSLANNLCQTLSEQYQVSFTIGISAVRKGLSLVSLLYMESFNNISFLAKAGTSKPDIKSNTFSYGDFSQYKNVDKLIVKAKQYIAIHYCDPYLSMPEAADYVGLNPSYFSAEFTKHEKQCFINYLTSIRIEKSKHLLTHTEDKIQTVSEAVGYINATYYSTLFKRAEGVTPTQYRRNHGTDYGQVCP